MSVLQGRQDSAATPGGDEVRRFGPATRWVHRATAALFGVCLATAAILYLPPLSLMFGRRALIADIHLYCGLALPVPALLGWLAGGFRRDTTELNRFVAEDGAWLRARLPFGSARRRAPEHPATGRMTAARPVSTHRVGGKFNAGQKLYAAVVAGSILVFLGTGLVMYLGQDLSIPDRYRTGASFVHTLLRGLRPPLDGLAGPGRPRRHAHRLRPPLVGGLRAPALVGAGGRAGTDRRERAPARRGLASPAGGADRSCRGESGA
jgi:formate dehydrogenase subunit gamma